MGAVTFTKNAFANTAVIDNKRVIKGAIAMSTSYATGGDTIDLKTVGLTQLDSMLVETDNPILATGGFSLRLGGPVNAPRILAYDGNGTEVTAGTNLSLRFPVGVWLLGA